MKKEIHMGVIGLLACLVIGAVVALGVADAPRLRYIITGVVATIIALATITVKPKDTGKKKVGSLIFFNGEEGQLAVGLDITADPRELLQEKDGVIDIVNMVKQPE